MQVISYLKQKGIVRALQVFYQYKLDEIFCKALLPFVKKKPLSNTIIIESHNDFDSNGGAFYDYLITNGYNKNYRIVWLLKNKRPDTPLPENVEALPLFKPSLRKAWHVCTAKYLIASCHVTNKQRSEQMSFYLTHGAVGLKNVRGLANLPDSVDYTLSPSENYAPILAEQLGFSRWKTNMHPFEYPQDDVLYTDTPGDLHKITQRRYKKVFLWMPTFRKGLQGRDDLEGEQPFGIPLVQTQADLDRIQSFLAQNECLLIIKIHPLQDPDTVKQLRSSENIRVLTGDDIKTLGVDNYRLIKDVDALLSDYSSIAYSFLLLNRPLGFVLSDLKDYKLGLAVENPEDYLVGHKIFNFDDFFGFLQDVCAGQDAYTERRMTLARWLYKYRDGRSCQRLAEFMGLEK